MRVSQPLQERMSAGGLERLCQALQQVDMDTRHRQVSLSGHAFCFFAFGFDRYPLCNINRFFERYGPLRASAQLAVRPPSHLPPPPTVVLR